MKLNRDVLIQSMLRHQQVFLQILDYMQMHDTGYEIPETLYMQLYARYIVHDSDENVASHLALETLVTNGVVVHNDRTTGMLSFERVVIDLLRFIDVKRQRELTRADFEAMRSQFYAATQQVRASAFASEDYHEAMQSMLQVLSEVHSKIRQNVAALEAQVEDVAMRYQNLQEHSDENTLIALYERVAKLHDRYVMPCYEFIDPNMQMQQTLSFSECLDTLIDYHVQNDAAAVAQKILYRRTAVSSYYKDIQRVTERLQRYSSFLERDRDAYMAIEAGFNRLMDEVTALRHGKRRFRFLEPNSEFFNTFQSFRGIKHLSRAGGGRINWADTQQQLRISEYLRSRSSVVEDTPEPKLQPINQAPDLDLLRQKQIFALLLEHQWPIEIADIYSYLNTVLREQLDNYSLPDALYGYSAFLALADAASIHYSGQRNTLKDKRYYFDYLVPQAKDSAHV